MIYKTKYIIIILVILYTKNVFAQDQFCWQNKVEKNPCAKENLLKFNFKNLILKI
jgi:hypothetical protein